MSELGWTGHGYSEARRPRQLDDRRRRIVRRARTGPLPGPLFSSAVLCARFCSNCERKHENAGSALRARTRLRSRADRGPYEVGGQHPPSRSEGKDYLLSGHKCSSTSLYAPTFGGAAPKRSAREPFVSRQKRGVPFAHSWILTGIAKALENVG